MNWYNYVACFFAGVFLSNFVPHLVNGVSGEKFPTPFAKPPGRGLSSPFINVLWALFNLKVGLVLIWCGHVSVSNPLNGIVALVGFSLMSMQLSFSASKKIK